MASKSTGKYFFFAEVQSELSFKKQKSDPAGSPQTLSTPLLHAKIALYFFYNNYNTRTHDRI